MLKQKPILHLPVLATLPELKALGVRLANLQPAPALLTKQKTILKIKQTQIPPHNLKNVLLRQSLSKGHPTTKRIIFEENIHDEGGKIRQGEGEVD